MMVYKSHNKTPSFTATINLSVNTVQEREILVISECARQIYNSCLGEALKRLDQIKRTNLYKETLKLSKTSNKDKKLRTKNFKFLNKKFNFTDFSIESFAIETKNASKSIDQHLGSSICQKIGLRAFATAQKLALNKVKKVYFQSKGQFITLEGKSNNANLRYVDGYVFIGKLKLKCLSKPNDDMMKHALNHRVKYCRLICKRIRGKNQFYVQLILEGIPYQKYEIGKGEAGIDIGPSSIAFVHEKYAFLKEFCERVVYLDKEKKRLQRLQERRRRRMNPHNYKIDGTCKMGKLTWNYSNRYIKTREEIAELERVLAAQRKQLHEIDANLILSYCNKVLLEKLSYKAFQKRYGRSVRRKAPSKFVAILKRKLEAQGGTVQEVSTYKTKLSQTCQCGTIKKKPLSQRWHKCECGVISQRDLYSAFLIKCVTQNGDLSFDEAKKKWPSIEPILIQAIERLKEAKKDNKRS
ncbi:transposase [Virgibacillus halodenitrificans]|uniref:transposase n=1 Tax=Virgibacillus halodenitrificans TaxID=1482 RepID=UPI001F330426|nr:transposase [Virgibacillus halodenitrificans]